MRGRGEGRSLGIKKQGAGYKSKGCTCRLTEQFDQHREQEKHFQAEVDLKRPWWSSG